MRALKVYNNDTFAGTLSEIHGEGYIFVYDDAYLDNGSLPAISLTLGKEEKTHISPTLFPFFANMLSEGNNRKIQAGYHHLDEADDYGILAATGGFDTPGAITVKEDGND